MNAFLTMITGATERPSGPSAREDRSHPNLQMLDSLQLSYPGFERDKREAEAVHFGHATLNLSFDAAIRRLRVKQRAHEEQRSIKTIHRSHPNLVSLDALKLTYPGWKKDVERAENIHNKNSDCDFFDVLRRLQIKQLRHENDRSHYRLVAIDQLKLSYPGWKADIRSLEKFHFEEAFFLPGDSLFQNKLDSLKRRQQIYIRSQKIRGTRSIFHRIQDEEEEEEAEKEEEGAELPTISTKGCYANLLGAQTNEFEPHYVSSEAENDPSSDEDRTDRQPIRAPYAVLAADIDSTVPDSDTRVDAEEESSLVSSPSLRAQVDPPSRPDPPEEEATSRDSETRNVRERVDCDASTVAARGGGVGDSSSQAYSNSNDDSDNNSSNEYSSSNHASLWASKLSSYVDPEPIPETEADVESVDRFEEREERDEIVDLPAPSRHLTPTGKYATYRGRKVKPRGRYSAPSLLSTDEEEQSTTSQAVSEVTQSSSRAVFFDDASIAAASRSSSQAVWTDEQSVASATSSGAVWAESPTPYVPETPSSTRAVQPIPDTPCDKAPPEMPSRPPRGPSNRPRDAQHGKESRERRFPESERRSSSRSKKKTSGGHSRKSRKSSSDESSRISKESRASSHGSSRSRKLGRCTICGDTDKNHVFVPCGHLCACKECASQVIVRKMSCPVCRGGVTEAIQVFL